MSNEEAQPHDDTKEPPDHDWLEQESIRKDWSPQDEQRKDNGD